MKMKKIISVLIHDRRGGFNVRKGLIIILLVASFATGVISYSSKPSALGRVKLSTKKVVLIQGKSCTIRLKGAKIKKVVWKSNNKKIATVRKGKIKAKKSGRCSVIAKYKGKKYRCNVWVKKNKLPATPKPTGNSQAIGPSAVPQSSWGTNGEANIKDAKLVIDSFVQNTKTITFSVYNTSQRMITLPTYFIVEKYDGKVWTVMPRKTNDVTADARYIMPGDKSVTEADLDNVFGELGQGKYRVRVQTSCGDVLSEFEII